MNTANIFFNAKAQAVAKNLSVITSKPIKAPFLFDSLVLSVCAKFDKGGMTFDQLAKIGTASGYKKAGLTSGKQEYLENILNQYILGI